MPLEITVFTRKAKMFKHTLLFSAIQMCAVGAYAEEKETRIEEVLVMERRAYIGDFEVLEVPQAELKIDSETLQNAAAFTLTQALDLSASVARQNNFGGLWNSFSVRGFVGDENLPSNFLVNGFNAGRGFGGPRDLSGVESVEILKGPRAALFGRGEPGGTINLVTKRPTFKQASELQFTAASFDSYRTDIDLDTPVSDSVAVRLVGFYEDANSFRDTVETTRYGVSPSVAFRFSDDSQLTYELELNHQEIPQDRGVIAINGELGLIPDSRFLGEPGDGPIETDVLGHQVEYQHDLSDNWSALVGFNYRDTSLEGFATENGFGAPDANGDFGRFRRFRDYDATYSVFRAELSGLFETGGIEHRVIVGLDSDKFENDQFFLRIRDRDDPSVNQNINIFNPVYGAYPLPAPLPNTDRLETQQSSGLYIQDQISVTNKLDIRIGARIDDYEQELINRRSDSTFEYSETRVSPQFGAVYKANDAFSIYAAYGENFRPLSGANGTNGLDPNVSTSMEAGLKFLLNDGALEGTFAVFDLEQSNISTVDGNFVQTAIGEAGSQGVELDVIGQLTDSLNLRFSYSFIDAKTENAYNDANFGNELPAGSDLLNVPENQLTVQLVQTTQLAGNPLSIIGGLIYVDDRNGFFSDQSFRLPSYTNVQLGAKYELSESFTLRANIDNLLDDEYYTNSFANVWVQPGTPRNYTVSAIFNF